MSPVSVLEIERCDLNTASNKVNHHTDLFKDERLIVRRGQQFCVTLCLKPGGAKFKAGETHLTITVETGPLPRKESGTAVSFGLTEESADTSTWSASAAPGPAEDTVLLTICSSADAPIGLYSLRLDQDTTKTSLGPFILLFNPWCSGDAVYMSSKAKKSEYVLSQHGLIYRGTPKRIKALPWNFGQFEEGILDICLKILDDNPKFVSDADQDCSARRNPVYVTRVLSAMINSQDDRGVLVGNWGEVTDGVHPGEWVGSGDILRKWAQSGPVRYGQCWVFAAVACAVSRTLGIPCRVVTNFGSAHDSDANLLIEKIYDAEFTENLSDDSIWNFHVWVDSWMARPDLGLEYNGWQASDPTPQETSEGVFCCGPAPVKAIKEGDLTKKYDAPFIFAEVNADVVEKVRLPNGKVVEISGSTKSVGKCISTKSVGSDSRHDITHKYKYAEGSEDERRVFEKAQHRNKLQKQGLEPGLHLKIKLVEGMVVGSDFEIYSVLTNNCMNSRSCNFMLFARTISYNGKRGENCGISSQKVDIKPGEDVRVALKLEYQRYGPVLTPDRLIQVSAFTVDENMDFCKAQKTIVLDEPDINIQVLGSVRVNSPVTVELTLLNPLPEPLHKCSFTAEGVGLTGSQPITVKVGDVGPKKEAKARLELKPTAAGSTVLLVNFDSSKLKNIKSFINVDVVKEETSP